MMKEKACQNFETLLPLLFYGDLGAGEQSRVEAHLKDCDFCQEAFAELKALETEIPRRPLYEPADEELFHLRQALSVKIRPDFRSEPKSKQIRRIFGFLKPAPAFQFGFAALLLVFGFLLGRESKTAAPVQPPPFSLEDFISASRQIQTGQTTVNPFVAGIEKLSYNPADGTVNIHYNTLNEVSLHGKFEDPMIRQMLLYAMIEEENPAVRLHAVEATNALVSRLDPKDDALMETLLDMMREERNQEVRLQAIRLLGKLPFTEAVKSVLFKLFLGDQDFAIRMQAFEALQAGDLDAEGIETLRQAAQNDANPYFHDKPGKRLEQI